MQSFACIYKVRLEKQSDFKRGRSKVKQGGFLHLQVHCEDTEKKFFVSFKRVLLIINTDFSQLCS